MDSAQRLVAIENGLHLAFDRTPRLTNQEKADHGEDVALRYFPHHLADPGFYYQMVWWPQSTSHAFDLVFLAYSGSQILQYAQESQFLDIAPDEFGYRPADHCVVVEAKAVTRRRGGLRSYLQRSRRHKDRQMSLSWIRRAASYSNPEWLGDLVLRYLDSERLKRVLVVKELATARIYHWSDAEFRRQGID